MDYETILLENASGVARLTLNRPDRLNCFTVQMHDEVSRALEAVSKSDARVLVLTGAGRGFCAGQDLGDRAVAPGGEGLDLGESLEKRYNPLIRKLATLDMPVVCAVNGVAAGAGANIALACDIVLAAKSATFLQAFAKIGLVPDSGGTWFLPRLVGPARARGLALLADPLPAEKAESWGLIWKCVPDDELIGAANELCQRFAVGPTYGLSLIKRALDASETNDLSTQLDLERDFQRSAGSSPDYKEGVSAFMEKRTPKFTGEKGS
jgi:2-(1,2-epoxy-1,2-dihydrophenyl)acetyl-CoA isomerase